MKIIAISVKTLACSLILATVLFAQTPTVAPPVITPSPGTFQNSVRITITSATPGAQIYYTTDGSAPTVASNLYTMPLLLTSSTTISAIAVLPNSSMVSSAFIVTVIPTTYNYTLGTSPVKLAFSWKTGTAIPPAQSLQVWDSSPCPPPVGVPTCHWTAQVSGDSPWIVIGTPSGSTSFNTVISVNPNILGAGTYTGNVILTNLQFKVPTIKVPVTLTVTGSVTPPPTHSVSLSWSSPNSQFNIYRTATSGTGYAKINPAPIAQSSFSDATVLAGTKLFYAVTALDSSGNESAMSSEVSAIIPTP